MRHRIEYGLVHAEMIQPFDVNIVPIKSNRRQVPPPL